MLGYNQTSWGNTLGQEAQPASASKTWADLTTAERSAAAVLGYTEQTWAHISEAKKSWSDPTSPGEDVFLCESRSAGVFICLCACPCYTMPAQTKLKTTLTHQIICHVAVDGGWSAFGACSKICEGGTQSRTCDNPAPVNGGKVCEGDATQECNGQPCAGTDCW